MSMSRRKWFCKFATAVFHIALQFVWVNGVYERRWSLTIRQVWEANEQVGGSLDGIFYKKKTILDSYGDMIVTDADVCLKRFCFAIYFTISFFLLKNETSLYLKSYSNTIISIYIFWLFFYICSYGDRTAQKGWLVFSISLRKAMCRDTRAPQ